MNTLIGILALAAVNNDVPPHIFVSMCSVESSLNPRAVAPNDGGEDSLGLCQIKLSTARYMGYKGNRAGLFDPEVNAKFAARYLRYQLRRYDGDMAKALTAYNAGRDTGNREYVEKVLNRWTDLAGWL